MAGLPVYSQQGRNGGWQLLGGATHRSERPHRRRGAGALPGGRAVVGRDAAGQGRAAQAGAGAARAVPDRCRGRVEAVVVDPTAWGAPTSRPRPAAPRRVAAGRDRGRADRPRLRRPRRDDQHAVVHPLGLATKGKVWYLVADTEAGLRTFRVDRVTVGRADGRAGGPTRGLRPRRRVGGDLGRRARHVGRDDGTADWPHPTPSSSSDGSSVVVCAWVRPRTTGGSRSR